MRRGLEGRQHTATRTRVRRRSGRRRTRTQRRRGGGGRLEVTSSSLKGSITQTRFVQRNRNAGRLISVGGNMHRKLRCRFGLLAAMALLVCAASTFAASRKVVDKYVGSVQVIVTDANDNAIYGAVVQLQNTTTLQLGSLFTKEYCTYYDH